MKTIILPEHRSLYRKLLRGLRYQRLDSLIGRSVEVTSEDSALALVEQSLQNEFPNLQGSCRATNISKIFQKYQLMDLGWEVDRPIPELARAAGARELMLHENFEVDEEDLEDDDDDDDDDDDELVAEFAGFCKSSLEKIAEAFSEDKVYLRLFLSLPKERSFPAAERFQFRHGIPEHLFPLKLDVVDACFTNSYDVWFSKHFYF